MRKWTQCVVAGLTVLSLAAVTLADDLESVEKKLTTAWEKHRSLSAKMTGVSRIDMGGMVMNGTSEGTLELQRSADKMQVRFEMKTTMVRKDGDNEMKMEQPATIIVDGDVSHVLTEMMGRKTALKTKTDRSMLGEPKALFAQFRKDAELKLLPDETIDGCKCFVVESTPKEKADMGPGKQVMYFDQEHGVMMKMVVHGPDDKPMSTMTFSDYKFDVKIDPERFKFVLPEGVTEIDQTAPTSQSSE